jgi:hypothetical protein
MCFLAAIQFALVDSVGLAASDRREAVFGIAFPDASDRSGVTADGFTDLRVSQAVIGVQETPCTREFPRLVCASRKHRVQFRSFIGRQIDRVLLCSWHEVLQRISEYLIDAL